MTKALPFFLACVLGCGGEFSNVLGAPPDSGADSPAAADAMSADSGTHVLFTSDPGTWPKAGQNPSDYTWGPDPTVLSHGQPTMRLQSSFTDGGVMEWAATGGSVSATPYLGMRVRMWADVKTSMATDGAWLWFRIDQGTTELALCNMIDPVDRRLKGTNDFTTLDCVLDVPTTATLLVFGLGLSGSGTAWMGPATFEQVGTDVPVSPHV